jgi:hypothetical protein
MFVVHCLIGISYITLERISIFATLDAHFEKKLDHRVPASLQQTYKPFTCSLLHFSSAKFTQLTSPTPLDS